MNDAKRKKLEAKGWRLGGAQEFLGLSGDDAAFIAHASPNCCLAPSSHCRLVALCRLKFNPVAPLGR